MNDRALAPAVALAVLAAVPLGAGVAHADARGARWLREHLAFEWTAASGGWRTSLDHGSQAPGFDALGGGTEVVLGTDVVGPLAVIAAGRFVGGVERGEPFFEGLAALGLQVRANDFTRVRAGIAAGQLIRGAARAPAVGGFLAGSIDLFTLGAGRLAAALSLRLDIDGLVDAPVALPERSLALTLGLGLRY